MKREQSVFMLRRQTARKAFQLQCGPTLVGAVASLLSWIPWDTRRSLLYVSLRVARNGDRFPTETQPRDTATADLSVVLLVTRDSVSRFFCWCKLPLVGSSAVKFTSGKPKWLCSKKAVC